MLYEFVLKCMVKYDTISYVANEAKRDVQTALSLKKKTDMQGEFEDTKGVIRIT